jgi:hypothetical protein
MRRALRRCVPIVSSEPFKKTRHLRLLQLFSAERRPILRFSHAPAPGRDVRDLAFLALDSNLRSDKTIVPIPGEGQLQLSQFFPN